MLNMLMLFSISMIMGGSVNVDVILVCVFS